MTKKQFVSISEPYKEVSIPEPYFCASYDNSSTLQVVEEKKICKAKLRVSKRQCNYEAFLGDYCMMHFNMFTDRLKKSAKDWKDKCKNCNRPKRLLPNGYCVACKNG